MGDSSEDFECTQPIAATAAEADQMVRLFDDAGIACNERLDADLEDTSSRICYLATVLEVDSARAERCRKLLTDIGLARGIV